MILYIYKFSFKTFLADGKDSKVVDVVLPRASPSHSLTPACYAKAAKRLRDVFRSFIGAIRTHTIKGGPQRLLAAFGNFLLKRHKSAD
jgi:hypothetical protein